MRQPGLTRFAWLSVAAAVVTIGLKFKAYLITDSVGLLSDAFESVVNLLAALLALAMLIVAARPADEEHAYGHYKAEYFSSGVEGALIFVAAALIAWTAGQRLFALHTVQDVDLGGAISLVASAINLGVAQILLRAGRRYRSITLEADAKHLMTDVWTSGGVLLGIVVVALTGWTILDPIIALLVALNILWSGFHLVRRSVLGLLDTALPAAERGEIQAILSRYSDQGIQYHALRTREAGAHRFVSFHILVPGSWTVQQGHRLLEEIEGAIRSTFPHMTVFTHLESLDDPSSWADMELERQQAEAEPGDREQHTQSPVS